MTAYAEVAAGLGRRIAADAIWHEGRCTWVAPVPDATSQSGPSPFGSLTPDLYSGTAGVGLVLAEIAAVTGDDSSTRHTALGAVRHSLARAHDLAGGAEIGLYTGRIGVALAAIRAGRLLEERELVERAAILLQGLRREMPEWSGDDLIGGRAGAALGLLAAAVAIGGSTELIAWAVELGGELLALGEGDAGWSRCRDMQGTGEMLTGLSHGAAGIAHALLELWATTGEQRFRAAADGVIEYEQRFHDGRTRNWRDLHETQRPVGAATATSSVFWCHGAPGIGLARHRAWRLTGEDARRREAAGALGVTAAWVGAAIRSGRGRFCLCHGVPGNAEVLWDGGDADPARSRAWRSLALAAADAGVEEYADRARPWPCGSHARGESPGLMQGLAGIARFYLRLALPRLPSLLLVSPGDDWLAGRPGGTTVAMEQPGAPSRR